MELSDVRQKAAQEYRASVGAKADAALAVVIDLAKQMEKKSEFISAAEELITLMRYHYSDASDERQSQVIDRAAACSSAHFRAASPSRRLGLPVSAGIQRLQAGRQPIALTVHPADVLESGARPVQLGLRKFYAAGAFLPVSCHPVLSSLPPVSDIPSSPAPHGKRVRLAGSASSDA